MLLFRVENLRTGEGLWYDRNTGENTRLVDALNLTNKNLPMEVDHSVALAEYLSAAESLDQLKFWFTHDDLRKLAERGFELSEYTVQRVHQHVTPLYTHPMFHMSWVTQRQPLSIDLIK